LYPGGSIFDQSLVQPRKSHPLPSQERTALNRERESTRQL
jgi:hypothetical protein